MEVVAVCVEDILGRYDEEFASGFVDAWASLSASGDPIRFPRSMYVEMWSFSSWDIILVFVDYLVSSSYA